MPTRRTRPRPAPDVLRPIPLHREPDPSVLSLAERQIERELRAALYATMPRPLSSADRNAASGETRAAGRLPRRMARALACDVPAAVLREEFHRAVDRAIARAEQVLKPAA